jgi:hypothetical protein
MNDQKELGAIVHKRMSSLSKRAVASYDRKLVSDLFCWLSDGQDNSFKQHDFIVRAATSGFPDHFRDLISSIGSLKDAMASRNYNTREYS